MLRTQIFLHDIWLFYEHALDTTKITKLFAPRKKWWIAFEFDSLMYGGPQLSHQNQMLTPNSNHSQQIQIIQSKLKITQQIQITHSKLQITHIKFK